MGVGAGGTLADYVPFSFAPRSPMLYVIHRGGVAGYQGGQAEVVHMVTSIERVVARCSSFVITDGHAATPLSKAYASLAGLDTVDWSIMAQAMWRDTDEDGDRKRRRQAEFLAQTSVPLGTVVLVGARNDATAAS